MSRILEIIKSGRAPGARCGKPAVDPDSVFHKAPKALKELESTPRFKHGPPHGAKGIEKHFGMNVSFIQKTWGI